MQSYAIIRRTKENKMTKNKFKNLHVKVLKNIEQKDKISGQINLGKLISFMSSNKKLFHKNKVARTHSRLQIKINSI